MSYVKDLIKIGFTERHINERLSELNTSSGTIGKYKCVLFIHCGKPRKLERDLHRHFSKDRDHKEFFKVTPEDVQAKALELLNDDSGYTIVIPAPRVKKPEDSWQKQVEDIASWCRATELRIKMRSQAYETKKAIAKSKEQYEKIKFETNQQNALKKNVD